jgi:hypothetical protein
VSSVAPFDPSPSPSGETSLRLGWRAGREIDWRVAAFAAAILIFGLFSQPAPAGLGPAELLIGLLLLASVGPVRAGLFAVGLQLRAPGRDRLELIALLALPLLLWPGLLRGMAMGWSGRDIIRDVVPLGFLFLPVLACQALPGWVVPGRVLREGVVDRLALAFSLAGLALALRWWHETAQGVGSLGSADLLEGQRYLLNSTAVAFAAVWLPLRALTLVDSEPARGGRPHQGRPSLWAWLWLLLGMAAGGICLTALAAAVYRGGVLLSLLALTIGVMIRGWQRPGRLLLPVLLLLLLMLPFHSIAFGLLDLLADKTGAVGLNSRGAELSAVMGALTDSPLALLLGQGWGGLLSNPAVGNWQVSYTHSALTYLLFKGGLLGLLVGLIYAGSLVRAILPGLTSRMDIACAAIPPILSGLLMHTSYKFLCFSICITLLLLAARSQKARGSYVHTSECE